MIAINAERLWSTLNEMARIGATPAGGVTRLTLSDEDRQARDLLRQWAQEAGFPCAVDSMGNMFIRRAGKNPQLVRKAGDPIGLQQSEAPADLWLDSLPGPDGVCLCS